MITIEELTENTATNSPLARGQHTNPSLKKPPRFEGKLTAAISGLASLSYLGGGPMGRRAVMSTQSDDNSQVVHDSRMALVSGGVDIAVGTAWAAARLTGRLAARGAHMTAPALGLVLRPPLVPRRLQPVYRVQLVVERWQRDRAETLRVLRRWLATALPGAVDAALGQVDVDQVATVVLNRVDLDALVADTVRRLDVEAVILAVLQGVDLTRIASTAIESPDIDRVVRDALGRLDVDEVAAQLLDQVDLTQLVLDRVDLGRVVAGALDPLDLTSIIVDQVNLGGVARSIALPVNYLLSRAPRLPSANGSDPE